MAKHVSSQQHTTIDAKSNRLQALSRKIFQHPLFIGIIIVAGIVVAITSASAGGSRIGVRFGLDGAATTGTASTVGNVLTFNNATTSPPVANGKFYIVGKDIVDPQGKIFYPMGANIAVRVNNWENGYTFNWNGTGTGRSQDVLNWGWNTVRPNNICNLSTNPSQQQLFDAVDAFIDEYTAKKIVVMVDCHDLTGKNPSVSTPELYGAYAMQDHLANKYKNNPYVWFNVLNEPQADGGPAASANWLALQKQTLARLRAIAPNNIYVADIPRYGQGVDTLTGTDSVLGLGAGQCNVLYSWHAYGAVGPFEGYANETKSRQNHKNAIEYLKNNNVPVVIGELGDPLTLNEGTAGQPIWNRIGAYAVMDYAPSNGIGLLWWHATGDSGNFLTYSLMADRHAAPWSAGLTGQGLSTAGQKFWQISKNKPNLGTFTGDLSKSNCK